MVGQMEESISLPHLPRLTEDKPILLAFSPVDNKQDLTAMSIYDFLVDTNDFYGKSLNNISFIVLNNCSTNQTIAKHCHSLGVLVINSIWQFSSIWRSIKSFLGKFMN